MEKGVFDTSLDIATKGTKQAMGALQDVMGTPKDAAVRVYQALQPSDLQQMEKDLGADVTFDYIRRMETRMRSGR